MKEGKDKKDNKERRMTENILDMRRRRSLRWTEGKIQR